MNDNKRTETTNQNPCGNIDYEDLLMEMQEQM
jgi:hypothetical protein